MQYLDCAGVVSKLGGGTSPKPSRVDRDNQEIVCVAYYMLERDWLGKHPINRANIYIPYRALMQSLQGLRLRVQDLGLGCNSWVPCYPL